MFFAALLAKLAAYLLSSDFHQLARHPDHPQAFTRMRKLPLPTLVAILLCSMRKSVQTELDEFFAHLGGRAALLRAASEQAFAQARCKLSGKALPALLDWLIREVEEASLIQRWHGLRLVAADASDLRFGLRACHKTRAAQSEQKAFALFLPGVELTLAATLYDPCVGERQMLFEHLDYLSPNDLLLLDRGYPALWLIAALKQRDIRFCMRIDKTGKNAWVCVREFLRSNLPEQIVAVRAPCAKDAHDYECPTELQCVRLIRQVTRKGQIRVLMTNLLDSERFPVQDFGDLYHQRWRIEEAFKRLKHRLQIEQVSALSQLAVIQDFSAKILCDNLQALACLACEEANPLPKHRRINHAYALSVLKPLLPLLLLGRACLTLINEALRLIRSQTYLHREGLSKPRGKDKRPRKHLTQKGC